MGAIFTNIAEIFAKSGWAQIFFTEGGWKYAVMLAVACVLLYLAIVKQFEPLLLLPIGFGMLMTNLPLDGIFHMDIFINETNHIDWALLGSSGGMVDYIYLGVKLGIYPPLIFLGIGTMTDFEPLIARPSSLLLGAAAQLGIFLAFVGALFLGFTPSEAGSIGIIGIALILALSSGVNEYIQNMEEETLSEYPLQIQSTGFDLTSMMVGSQNAGKDAKDSGKKNEIKVQEVVTTIQI